MAKTGNGMHYYPIIINDNLYDTITHKYLNLTDTTFLPGQLIIFEVDYFAQDSVSHLQLWAGKSKNSLQLAIDTPFLSIFYTSPNYSYTKKIDTFLFHYTLPAGLDSATRWILEPRVITTHNLQTRLDAVINIR
ncbi:MAG: hypothetical protein EPN37_02975 [Chitinophagaceae bacterium]|nr:MAG: hypothetical protein EPN37_02975 [Chitinophagaceae bacterium]